MTTYKLYFYEMFTGRKLLRMEFDTYAELCKAWTDPRNSDYLLKATKEEEIEKMPKRPRNLWENVS